MYVIIQLNKCLSVWQKARDSITLVLWFVGYYSFVFNIFHLLSHIMQTQGPQHDFCITITAMIIVTITAVKTLLSNIIHMNITTFVSFS